MWNSTTGSVEIWFRPPVEVVLPANKTYTGTPAKVSVEDLQWLEASGITLELSNASGRTLSITSIEKSGNDWVSVKLNLTRSAEPTQTGMIVNTGKATVSISLPNDFTAKYPDGITWDNKQFDF